METIRLEVISAVRSYDWYCVMPVWHVNIEAWMRWYQR